ncbi:MAG: 2-oxoacid:ferredoxin oxidoreductase subunit beta [Bacteroidales bacterium]|jgi:2-oxoglutarate ferredoxin oxidoreductase subunit beta|nr:2-oxoacid:ferredoxin oxidoreductase subunit beta [Bacteroidales bacterium]
MEPIQYKPADFKSSQDVRWCPGCGDYAILNSLQKAMAELGVSPDQTVVVSGIGCSSRLPYYVNSYGMHTIHGRASAIASGVKVANPELTVWQITGDGDCLAIGGNHFIHAVRRNINLNILLFNNEIYGLTKGQYSPTSRKGFVSKSSPYGTVEEPFSPSQLTLGARGTFFARTLDVDLKTSQEVLLQAAKHAGCAVVEALVNCVIFNDGTHKNLSDKAFRADRTIVLKHGEPMLYGANNDKGLIIDGFNLKSVTVGENGITEKDILVHDAHCQDPTLHFKLGNMKGDLPVALGVIRSVEQPTYDQAVVEQIADVQAKRPTRTLEAFLHTLETWEID